MKALRVTMSDGRTFHFEAKPFNGDTVVSAELVDVTSVPAHDGPKVTGLFNGVAMPLAFINR